MTNGSYDLQCYLWFISSLHPTIHPPSSFLYPPPTLLTVVHFTYLSAISFATLPAVHRSLFFSALVRSSGVLRVIPTYIHLHPNAGNAPPSTAPPPSFHSPPPSTAPPRPPSTLHRPPSPSVRPPPFHRRPFASTAVRSPPPLVYGGRLEVTRAEPDGPRPSLPGDSDTGAAAAGSW